METLGPNAAVARKAHQLFSEGRIDEVLPLLTDDVVMDAVSFGRRFSGKAEFRVFLKTLVDAFPDIAMEWESHRDTSDGVVVQARWRGTHRGPLATPAGAIPATGRAVEGLRLCEVMTFRDGKIAAITNYQDAAALMGQLGLAG